MAGFIFLSPVFPMHFSFNKLIVYFEFLSVFVTVFGLIIDFFVLLSVFLEFHFIYPFFIIMGLFTLIFPI